MRFRGDGIGHKNIRDAGAQFQPYDFNCNADEVDPVNMATVIEDSQYDGDDYGYTLKEQDGEEDGFEEDEDEDNLGAEDGEVPLADDIDLELEYAHL